MNSTVTVQATPNMGYKLDKWGGEFASHESSTGFSFQITSDMTPRGYIWLLFSYRSKRCRIYWGAHA